MWIRLWAWFKMAREDMILLFFAWRNPATPRYLKTMIWVALGYLVSPIDFIPDYLPVVGMVDDLTLVPAVLYAITLLLPPGVRVDAVARAVRAKRKMPYILTAAAAVLLIWMAFLIWGVYTLLK